MTIKCWLVTLVIIAACTGPVNHPGTTAHRRHGADARTFVYQCPDGYEFTARIEGQTAWLFLPGQTVALSQVPSGSGAKYSRGAITLWSKGKQALLATGKQAHRGCRNNRSRAIWEHAKLNGVDFRAVGNEPGWHLEISSDKMVFVGDYGQTVLEFKTLPPAVSRQQRQTTYRAENGLHHLVVRIAGRRCQDTMSGEAFEAAVSVTLDGRLYHGCSRALH